MVGKDSMQNKVSFKKYIALEFEHFRPVGTNMLHKIFGHPDLVSASQHTNPAKQFQINLTLK